MAANAGSSPLEPEINEKKRLRPEGGAAEFWVRDLEGNIRKFHKDGGLQKSRTIPDFPEKISLW